MSASRRTSRAGRLSVLLAATCSLFPVTLIAQGPPPPILPGVAPGPYAVGYTVRQEYDHSRTFKQKLDYFGERTPGEIARPIQITIWYPAAPGSGGAPMRLSDYYDVIATETDFRARSPEELRDLREEREQILMIEWRVAPDSMRAVRPRLDSLLALPTSAVRDAPPAAGRFPLILHLPGYNGSSGHNPLFEYLASHGFVVASVPNMGMYSRSIDDEPRSLDVQARDLEFAYAVMRTLPYVDADKVGTTGMSWGGLSNVLFASRNAYVGAVVTLDGAITMPVELEHVERVPGYSHQSFRTPYLQLLVSPEEARFRPKDLRFWDALRYADATMVQFNGVGHDDFALEYPRLRNAVEADPARAAYLETFARAQLEYVLRFFQAALNQDEAAGASLAGLSKELGLPDSMVARFETKRALKAPPSAEEFRDIVRTRGAKVAAEVYRAATEVQPDNELITSPVMGPLYMEAFNAGRFDEALAICELWRVGMPDAPGPLFSMGRTYRAMGNNEKAIDTYERILAMVPEGPQAENARRALAELRGGGA
jgi:dienelactone hydrolase